MEHPYKNQEQAKSRLRIGDYILFSDFGGAINSGTVDYRDGNIVRISNINGEGDSTVLPLSSLKLYYDTQWDDAPAEEDQVHEGGHGGEKKPKRKHRSRAKYQKGERITSLDELMAQNFIYCFDKITHHGWFQSWHMGLADQYIKRGVLFKAVMKNGGDRNG